MNSQNSMKTFKVTIQASAQQTFIVEAVDAESAKTEAHEQFIPIRHEDLQVFQSTHSVSEVK